MQITQERVGQIAMLLLRKKMGRDALSLNSQQIRSQVTEEAKNLGIAPRELAAFAMIMYTEAFEKTMTELNAIK